MGLTFGFSDCDCCDTAEERPSLPVEPKPHKFSIIKIEQIKNNVVALIHYDGCTNYEGRKVLVYSGIGLDVVKTAKSLDPHFCKYCKLSPFARFEPTMRGWLMALSVAESLSDIKEEKLLHKDAMC